MATIAIGDIHGNLLTLSDLLAKVIPDVERDDVIVFLGDYIDRGPDTRRCLEQIIKLKQDARCSIVTLLGNHEQWMLQSLRDPTRHSWLMCTDALPTIASYSETAAMTLRREFENAGPRLLRGDTALPYHVFFGSLPPSHLDFFNHLTPYYRSPEVLCVHGGADPHGKPPETSDLDVLIWGGTAGLMSTSDETMLCTDTGATPPWTKMVGRSPTSYQTEHSALTPFPGECLLLSDFQISNCIRASVISTLWRKLIQSPSLLSR